MYVIKGAHNQYYAGFTDTGYMVIYHWYTDPKRAKRYSFISAVITAGRLKRDGVTSHTTIEKVKE